MLSEPVTQQDLVDAHFYIEGLPIDDTLKDTCRGIMLGRYWAGQLERRGMEITDYSLRQLIDMVAQQRFAPPDVSA